MKITAKQFMRFHIIMTGVWGLLLIPTMIWWREAIPWVVFMSWYANFVGHITGWNGARAEKKVDDGNDQG